MGYTYSRWTGGGECGGVDPDDLLAALSDDLLAEGDLDRALKRVARCGVPQDGEDGLPGIDALMQQARDRRRHELERYSLDSTLDDIREQVQEVIERERAAIDRMTSREGGSDAAHEASRAVAQRKCSFLEGLPADRGSAIPALANYEFLDGTARAQFTALTEMLQRHVLQTHFASMRDWLGDLGTSDLQDLKEMLRDLNAMLEDRIEGREPHFARFQQEHGAHFPHATSLDDVILSLLDQSSHTEALMSSMSPEMRAELDRTLRPIVQDPELRRQLGRMEEVLSTIVPPQPSREYPFSGAESVTLDEALDLMRRMHDFDHLLRQMHRWEETGDLGEIDADLLASTLGENARDIFDRLHSLPHALCESGYAEVTDGELRLTARGIRQIGHRALIEIFRRLKRDTFGPHGTAVPGRGIDPTDHTKVYEWGDPPLIDLSGTLVNAIRRSGGSLPVRLCPTDFEVFRTEQTVSASTVLMVDMSRSMPLRGCYAAAKKVALALNSLIRAQYPRDTLFVVGFSDYARQLQPEELQTVDWSKYLHGTNMQHGFMIARKLLGRHRTGNRQIILITDGEPTAHFDGERVEFAYPPTPRTFSETLREVKRCTQEGITINTFMLERSHYLAEFVHEMTRINSGRAFFATPERLGDYVVIDYLTSRRRGAGCT